MKKTIMAILFGTMALTLALAKGPSVPFGLGDDSDDSQSETNESASSGIKPVKTITADGMITDLAYSSDGAKILYASRAILYILNASDGSQVSRFGVKDGTDIDVIAYAPSGAVASYAYTNPAQIMLWNEAGKKTGSLGITVENSDDAAGNPNVEKAKAYRIQFTPDGKNLVEVSQTDNNGGVKLWDIASGKATPLSAYDDTSVYGLSFAPEGDRFATISRDGKLVIWNLKGKSVAQINTGDELKSSYDYKDAGFLANGTIVVLRQGQIELWSANGKRISTPVTDSATELGFVRVSKDGKLFAVANSGGGFTVYRADGSVVTSASDDSEAVTGLAFSPDGTKIAVSVTTLTQGGEIRIFSVR